MEYIFITKMKNEGEFCIWDALYSLFCMFILSIFVYPFVCCNWLKSTKITFYIQLLQCSDNLNELLGIRDRINSLFKRTKNCNRIVTELNIPQFRNWDAVVICTKLLRNYFTLSNLSIHVHKPISIFFKCLKVDNQEYPKIIC